MTDPLITSDSLLHATESSRSASPSPRRLRVLQMIGRLNDLGGAERFTIALATGLPRDRFDVWVCAPRGASSGAARALARAGVPLVDLGRRGKLDAFRTARLLGLLRRERFDVLHSHMFGSNLWATVLGRAAGVPVLIAHEHTWSYEGDRKRAWLDGHVIGPLTTRFVAVSDADAAKMVSVEGVAPDKITVIPTGYVPHPVEATVDLRTELGLDPGTPLVGTVAIMRPQKALEVLLSAHARVRESIPRAHLVIAGDGHLRGQLERHAEQLGIADATHFLGFRRDGDAIIRALDVATMSSDFEGMPLFMFECMANGTPLVATAVGGLPEAIENERSGLLVAPRRPDLLAAAIVRLLSDAGLRERLAASAATRLARHSMEEISGRFAELYDSLVVASPGRSGGRRPIRNR
jgi:glycosyltransferase involved in cell wall biosynthesis